MTSGRERLHEDLIVALLRSLEGVAFPQESGNLMYGLYYLFALSTLMQHGQLPRPDRGRGQSGGGCAISFFSSTAAGYGNPPRVPVREEDPTVPTSPYGSSKLMSEIMLRDAGIAHGLRQVILRYFNVAGADPLGRIGQSTKEATHLIKVAVETALGRRPKMDVFGTDYPTLDGTCIVAAHSDALAYLRDGGASATLNCGYGRGFSVLDVIDTVKRVAGVDFKVELAPRRPGDPTQIVAACDRVRSTLGWQPRFDNLQTIVAHTLAWERKLSKRAG